jgi:hypothetical protein
MSQLFDLLATSNHMNMPMEPTHERLVLFCLTGFVATEITEKFFVHQMHFQLFSVRVLCFDAVSWFIFRYVETVEKIFPLEPSFTLFKYHFHQITQFFTLCTLINGQALLYRPRFAHFPSVMPVKLLAIFHATSKTF